MSITQARQGAPEDVWIKSTCSMCFSMCAIRVHRVDGVVVNIEGNPDCPTSRGGICAKGVSGMMLLYDPNRVNVPLKRTNPEKGIGIDPGWVEISWDEALATVTAQFEKIKAEDPRKLLTISSIIARDNGNMNKSFSAAFGTPNHFNSGAGMHCGNGSHLFSGLMHCSWTRMPDPNYVNYYLNFGCPSGFGAYYCATGMARRMADARERGMKHVVIEPWMGMPGLNSDEWVPIRPGTDAALALAMINLLLNEYGLFDGESLRQYTNGPYLIGADGHYVRDRASQKPLLWDLADGQAKTYDDPTLRQAALEGRFSLEGAAVRTAFTLIKEHVQTYTPEMAARITTVPAETIRRLAREFGEAACIGATIIIDGQELPYRPVSLGFFRGAVAHRHSALTCMALELLQEIVGANSVPGGVLGMNARALGHPDTGQPSYDCGEGPDGLLRAGSWGALGGSPWPMAAPQKPERIGMNDLVPTAGVSPLVPWGILEGERYKLPYKPAAVLRSAGNYMMALTDPALMEKAFKEDIFSVAFCLYLDESAEFADIVLPDACYLEKLDLQADWDSSISPVDEWAVHIRQPVVEPLFERRPAQQVLLELAARLGILDNMYRQMNKTFAFKEPYTLDPTRHYTWEEIVDRRLKGDFGPERGLTWFKENGLIHWPKKTEEVYWRPFVKGRTPIYFEHFLTLGRQIDELKQEHDIPGFATGDFQPLPDWKPCASHEEQRPGFDLYGIYYRVPLQTFTSTYNNPWLDEASRMNPHIYYLAMNGQTARQKGINDGDWVVVESAGTGQEVEGRVIVTEAVHPEVLAYASGGGHWARNLPIASQPEKGICPQWLIPLSWDYLDTVSLNLDLCVKVKVTKKAEKV